MELFSSNIKKFQVTETPKKFLTFSQKKSFLTFWETETPKKFFIFQETEHSYISGNGTFLYFRKRNILIFQEIETLKKFLYFRKRNFLSSKSKKNPLWRNFFDFHKRNILAPRLRNFLYFPASALEKSFSYVLGNGTFLSFGKRNFLALRIKHFRSYLFELKKYINLL